MCQFNKLLIKVEEVLRVVLHSEFRSPLWRLYLPQLQDEVNFNSIKFLGGLAMLINAWFQLLEGISFGHLFTKKGYFAKVDENLVEETPDFHLPENKGSRQ